MFETGVRQFRLALGLVYGRRLDTANLARLVGDALATRAEFGELGADARELLDGPFTDPEVRDDFAVRALRRTARRLARRSPFYAERFRQNGIDPRQLDLERLREVPVTTKRDLLADQRAFVCAGEQPHLATRTTGTTGRPAEIWCSREEFELWTGMSALTAVLRDELSPHDVMQVHVSSRATASVQLTAGICRLVGAGCRVLGVVPVDEALDALTDGPPGARPTLMSTSASYLAELVTAARRRGLTPDDLRLKRIDVGGEVLSSTVRAAAETVLGARVNDAFGMTEVLPVTAATCSQGHLHHDLSMGLVELLDLESGAPAAPGDLATVVITPYHPFRQCMPVLRYDTRDVVRVLPDAPLTCELAGLPGTGRIVGKADQVLRLGAGRVVTPRDLVEAVEALPSRPWPARFRAREQEGRLRLVLPAGALDGLTGAQARDHFGAHGLDADLETVPDDDGPGLRPLRSDLHETTFVAAPRRRPVRPVPIGAPA